MKVHLKFDHDLDCTLKALDCPVSTDQLYEQIDEIIRKFMREEKYNNRSHLAELIHDEIDYSAILYMATKYVTKKFFRQR